MTASQRFLVCLRQRMAGLTPGKVPMMFRKIICSIGVLLGSVNTASALTLVSDPVQIAAAPAGLACNVLNVSGKSISVTIEVRTADGSSSFSPCSLAPQEICRGFLGNGENVFICVIEIDGTSQSGVRAAAAVTDVTANSILLVPVRSVRHFPIGSD
jgi:hypothetical protein